MKKYKVVRVVKEPTPWIEECICHLRIAWAQEKLRVGVWSPNKTTQYENQVKVIHDQKLCRHPAAHTLFEQMQEAFTK